MAAKSKPLDGKLAPPDFGRDLTGLLIALRKKGQKITLSINGQGSLAVEDEKSFRELTRLVDRLETIAGVKRGLEDFENGRSQPLSEVIAEMKRKYNLPD